MPSARGRGHWQNRHQPACVGPSQPSQPTMEGQINQRRLLIEDWSGTGPCLLLPFSKLHGYGVAGSFRPLNRPPPWRAGRHGLAAIRATTLLALVFLFISFPRIANSPVPYDRLSCRSMTLCGRGRRCLFGRARGTNTSVPHAKFGNDATLAQQANSHVCWDRKLTLLFHGQLERMGPAFSRGQPWDQVSGRYGSSLALSGEQAAITKRLDSQRRHFVFVQVRRRRNARLDAGQLHTGPRPRRSFSISGFVENTEQTLVRPHQHTCVHEVHAHTPRTEVQESQYEAAVHDPSAGRPSHRCDAAAACIKAQKCITRLLRNASCAEIV